jgi:hypothetical protein
MYYPNYILCCSPVSKMRLNMAFAGMLPMIGSPAAWVFGKISDHYQDYRPSFVLAMIIIAATVVLVVVALPAHPRPRREDMDESDLALEAQGAKATAREGMVV